MKPEIAARHRSDQRGRDGQRVDPADEQQGPVFAGSLNQHNRGFCATFPHCAMDRSWEVKKGFTATYKTSQPQRLFRSEEDTSELQSPMRISYAVLCLKQQKITTNK